MRKRGYTLGELLVVMSLTTTTLMLCMAMIHRVMHEQKHAERENAVHRVAERLSYQFRRDVHGAFRADLNDDKPTTLTLHHPNERIVTYALTDRTINRVATGGEATPHRDSFEFPETFVLALTARDSSNIVGFEVAAALHRSGEDPPGQNRLALNQRPVIHVDASIGRDLRFSRTKEADNS